MSLTFIFGLLVMTFVLRASVPRLWMLRSVSSLVFGFLPLFFRRFCSDRRRRFFVRQWGARCVVACVRDNILMVHI